MLLNWEALPFQVAPTAWCCSCPTPCRVSSAILVFKGLFNQNVGEVNLILGQSLRHQAGVVQRPVAGARLMLLIVNVWLGFPYMMVLCTGLIKAIPADLYEASAVAGAGALGELPRASRSR